MPYECYMMIGPAIYTSDPKRIENSNLLKIFYETEFGNFPTEVSVGYKGNVALIYIPHMGICMETGELVLCGNPDNNSVLKCFKGMTMREQLEYFLKQPKVQKQLSKFPSDASSELDSMLDETNKAKKKLEFDRREELFSGYVQQ